MKLVDNQIHFLRQTNRSACQTADQNKNQPLSSSCQTGSLKHYEQVCISSVSCHKEGDAIGEDASCDFHQPRRLSRSYDKDKFAKFLTIMFDISYLSLRDVKRLKLGVNTPPEGY